jgi:hypothetical protein
MRTLRMFPERISRPRSFVISKRFLRRIVKCPHQSCLGIHNSSLASQSRQGHSRHFPKPPYLQTKGLHMRDQNTLHEEMKKVLQTENKVSSLRQESSIGAQVGSLSSRFSLPIPLHINTRRRGYGRMTIRGISRFTEHQGPSLGLGRGCICWCRQSLEGRKY